MLVGNEHLICSSNDSLLLRIKCSLHFEAEDNLMRVALAIRYVRFYFCHRHNEAMHLVKRYCSRDNLINGTKKQMIRFSSEYHNATITEYVNGIVDKCAYRCAHVKSFHLVIFLVWNM